MSEPIYQGMMPQGQTPSPVNAMANLDEHVQELINAALNTAEAKHAAEISRMRTEFNEALANARQGVNHLIPEHAGGPATELAPTWSMFYQELARAGKLTVEHLAAAGLGSAVGAVM